MELIWSINVERMNIQTSCCFEILDEGEIVFIPIKENVVNGKRQVEYLSIDKTTGTILQNCSPLIKEFDKLDIQSSYENKDYVFGSKTIKSKSIGGQIIECLENGKPIWKFRHWAYLYTDIIQKNDCVIFGTDGNGSRLYCIDIAKGQLISETKTQFTGFYAFYKFNWYQGNIVIYGKGMLTLLNPFTGEIIDEYKIPSKYPYRSFLQVIDSYAYCCVLTDNNQPTIICFDLSRN